MQTDKKNQLLYNFSSLGVAQVINSLLQLLVIPYVITKIGMENFGVVAVAQVVMYYLGTFTDFGFNQTATRFVSQNRSNAFLLANIFSRVYITKFFLCSAAFVILLLLAFIFPFVRNNFSLYCMAFLFVPGYASQPVWFLQGMERMQYVAIITLLSRVIFVSLVFIFIQTPHDGKLFVFFLGLGNLITGIASSWLVIKQQKLRYIASNTKEVIRELQSGWHVTMSNLSMNVIQYGNIFILRLFTNDLVVGYFNVAERIFFAMKYVLGIFSQAIYPRICQLAANGSLMIKQFFRKTFIPFFLLIMGGCTFVFIFSPFVLKHFMKVDSHDSIFILRMLCVIMPVICLNIPASLALLAFDHRKTYFTIYTSAMLLNILCNCVLAYFFGYEGTLAAIFITEIFIVVGVWLAFNKHFSKGLKDADKAQKNVS